MKPLQKGITLLGAKWCPWCKKVSNHLQQNKIKHLYIDTDQNEKVFDQYSKLHKYRKIPMIFFDGEFKKGADAYFQNLQKNMEYLNRFKQ